MNSQERSRHPRWLLLLIPGGGAIIILAGLGYLGIFTHNFRVVSPKKVYRSGQMHERELRKTITAYGIKTIINLRGMSSSPSYLEELKVANELGVRHVDIEISARQLPPPEKVEELLKTFAKGPYPILVHCSGGADRSGLASVLYRVICEDEPFTSALKEQLTWRYGHFAVGQRRAMDDFFKLYLQTGAKKDFAQWIIEDYPEVYLRYGQK